MTHLRELFIPEWDLWFASFEPPTIHKIFETNSSEIAHYRKGSISVCRSFLLVLTKFSIFWKDWAVGYNPTKF